MDDPVTTLMMTLRYEWFEWWTNPSGPEEKILFNQYLNYVEEDRPDRVPDVPTPSIAQVPSLQLGRTNRISGVRRDERVSPMLRRGRGGEMEAHVSAKDFRKSELESLGQAPIVRERILYYD